MYYIGFDLGSSSIKAALVEISTGKSVGVVQEPKTEMSMLALKNGWAEQDPEEWWQYICKVIENLKITYNVSETQILPPTREYLLVNLYRVTNPLSISVP